VKGGSFGKSKGRRRSEDEGKGKRTPGKGRKVPSSSRAIVVVEDWDEEEERGRLGARLLGVLGSLRREEEEKRRREEEGPCLRGRKVASGRVGR